MTKISTLHQEWMKKPGYKAAYESTRAEFELAQKLIETRIKRGSAFIDPTTKHHA
jgi:hypothetical protein